MRMTMIRIAALAAGVLAAAAAQAQALKGLSATTVVIGQSAPLSGANAELGNDIRLGALAYFAKVNAAGGVHGRKIELTTLDDANQVPRAEANTKKLVEEDGVFALFGYASATLSRPALPIVDKYGVPFLSPFTGADPMRVFNKYVYNMRGSYAEELEKIVDHFVPLGVKRFSIVYYDDVVGRENFSAVERALKKRSLEVVSTASFKDRAKPEIAAGVASVAKGRPDVVILTTLYKATADFIRQAQASGLGAQMVEQLLSRRQPARQGTRQAGRRASSSRPWCRRRASARCRSCTNTRLAIEQHTGKKEFSFTSLESYIAAKVTVEALRRAGPKLSRENFMQALDGLKSFDTGGYVVGFSPSNHNGSSFVELTVIGRDQKFNY